MTHSRYITETVKAVGRPCLLSWDPDYKGVKIKDVHLQLDVFKQFVQDGIKSTETILREQLFFGMDLPTIDLRMIKDEYGKVKSEYSFLKGPANMRLNMNSHPLGRMKSADPSKHLIDAQGRWNTVKVMEYLKGNKKFLRKLMKGISPKVFKPFFCLYDQMYISLVDSHPEASSSGPSSIKTRRAALAIMPFQMEKHSSLWNTTRPERARTIPFTSSVSCLNQSPFL